MFDEKENKPYTIAGRHHQKKKIPVGNKTQEWRVVDKPIVPILEVVELVHDYLFTAV